MRKVIEPAAVKQFWVRSSREITFSSTLIAGLPLFSTNPMTVCNITHSCIAYQSSEEEDILSMARFIGVGYLCHVNMLQNQGKQLCGFETKLRPSEENSQGPCRLYANRNSLSGNEVEWRGRLLRTPMWHKNSMCLYWRG